MSTGPRSLAMMVFLLYAASQQRCSVIVVVVSAATLGLRVFGAAAETAKAERAAGPSAENFSVCDSDRSRPEWRDSSRYSDALIGICRDDASKRTTKITFSRSEGDGAVPSRARHEFRPRNARLPSRNMTVTAFLRGNVSCCSSGP